MFVKAELNKGLAVSKRQMLHLAVMYSIYVGRAKTILKQAPCLKPRPNEQALFWQTFEVLLVKHNVCGFGHYKNKCLTNILCL